MSGLDYTIGEAKALLAPFLDLDPEQIEGFVLLAFTDEGIRMQSNSGEDNASIRMAAALGEALCALLRTMEESVQ